MHIWDQLNLLDIKIDHRKDGHILLKHPLVEIIVIIFIEINVCNLIFQF